MTTTLTTRKVARGDGGLYKISLFEQNRMAGHGLSKALHQKVLRRYLDTSLSLLFIIDHFFILRMAIFGNMSARILYFFPRS